MQQGLKSAQMVKLLLLRHAKSDWGHSGLGDHERPLSKRGTKAAPMIARHIAKQNLKPDLIICSDAIRTRATLALVLPELGSPPPETIIDEQLYLASAETILATVRKYAHNEHQNVMVIAHNPGLHGLALTLAGQGDRMALRNLAMKFPTAALAVISFKADDWSDVAPAKGALKEFITPRELD